MALCIWILGQHAPIAAGLTTNGVKSAGCSGQMSLSGEVSSRINWKMHCDGDDAEGITLWIKRNGIASMKGWPEGFSQKVRGGGPGAKGSGVCSGNRVRAAVTCRIYTDGEANPHGWIVVAAGTRCANQLTMSRSLEAASRPRKVMIPASEQLFRGRPNGCS